MNSNGNTAADPTELSAAELEELLGQMRDKERGIAYRVARVTATIHVDRWWLTLQGQKDAFEKRDALEGQIVAGIILRNLYRKGVDYPLCSSNDGGVSGVLHDGVTQDMVGIPDGNSCATCRWNQFGSAKQWEPDPTKEQRGKGCKERRALAMILPDQDGVVIVRLSTKSISEWDTYAQVLDRSHDSYIKHMTHIGVEEVSEGGNNYGVAKFSSVGVVEQKVWGAALLSKNTAYVPLLTAQAMVENSLPMDTFSVPSTERNMGEPPDMEEDWEGYAPEDGKPF